MKLPSLLAALVLTAAGLCAEPVAPTLKNDLVAVDGKKVKRYDDAKVAGVKYFAFYYSAHWCPPCRAFTPDLVAWYNTTKPQHPEFELIFVSSDENEKAMEGYMTETSMPWPALKLSKKKSNKLISGLAGRGIPCLVLVDANGKVLSHSYEGANYVGPRKVLQDIDATLAGKAPAAN